MNPARLRFTSNLRASFAVLQHCDPRRALEGLHDVACQASGEGFATLIAELAAAETVLSEFQQVVKFHLSLIVLHGHANLHVKQVPMA